MKIALTLLATMLGASAFALDGVAYTTEVVVNSAEITLSSSRRNNEGPFVAEVSLDVRALTARRAWASGSYDAELYCPSPIVAESGETLRKTGNALSSGVVFRVSVPAHRRTGHDAETWRCWIRLQVSASPDSEDPPTPHVDELLPVDVTYEWRHRA